MVQSTASVNHRPTPETTDGLRFDWLRASLVSGFIATFATTVALAGAFGLANTIGQPNGTRFERWMEALSSNQLTRDIGDRFAIGMVLNLAFGLLWAMVYARWGEPVLSGPGWKRGATFALIPWILSLVVFFPVAGAGFFGSDLHAGPMPVIGNLVLHLVFGAVLGGLYAIETGSGVSNQARDMQANANGERGATFGMLIGAVIGLIGGWFLGPSMSELGNEAVIAFAGALSGAAMGMFIGSILGLKVDDLV